MIAIRDGTCWHPRVNGLTLMVNSIFNSSRMEDMAQNVASIGRAGSRAGPTPNLRIVAYH